MQEKLENTVHVQNYEMKYLIYTVFLQKLTLEE